MTCKRQHGILDKTSVRRSPLRTRISRPQSHALLVHRSNSVQRDSILPQMSEARTLEARCEPQKCTQRESRCCLVGYQITKEKVGACSTVVQTLFRAQASGVSRSTITAGALVPMSWIIPRGFGCKRVAEARCLRGRNMRVGGDAISMVVCWCQWRRGERRARLWRRVH
jgi:hypothetical protein